MIFLGIKSGASGCRMQHLVADEHGRITQKTSDIVLWVVYQNKRGILYIPVSKLDLEQNPTIVPSQFYSAINDRSRSIIKKTENGTSIIPFGAIIENR